MGLDAQAPATAQTSASHESLTRVYNILTTWGFLDEDFPMWMQIFQTTKIPVLVYFPFLLAFFVHSIATSMWLWSKYWNQPQNQEMMKWIRTICFFMPQPPKEVNYIIVSGTFGLFNLLSTIMIRTQINFFKYRRKFVSWLNIPLRLYFEAVCLPFTIPSVVVFGETFLLIAKGNTSVYVIVSFVFSIINQVYVVFFFLVVHNFASNSIYLNITPLLNFDGSFMNRFSISINSSFALFFVFSLFENWSYLVIAVCNIFVFSYIAYIMVLYIYLVDVLSMSTCVGFSCSCVAGNIFTIIEYIYPSLNCYVVLFTVIGLFVFGTVASLTYFILRTNQIAKHLAVEKGSQEEYDEYYNSLKLADNSRRALTYLRIGFQKNCVCFYNLSLLKYISDRFEEDEKAIRMCTYLLNFFPKETRLQAIFENKLLQVRKLDFVSRFLLFQIESLKTVRQFSDNMLLRSKLLEMKNLTRQCEMMAKSAFDDKFSQNFLESFAHLCNKTRALWKEAIKCHPNSSKLCEEYAKYLIEVDCDFPFAIKIKNRQQMIELGQNYCIDFCFRSFVATFPKYLTEKIVNIDGSINKDNEQQNKGWHHSRNSHNENNESLNTELDNEIEEHIGKQVLKLSKERIALHRMLENKIPFPIRMLKWVLLFIIVILFVICVGGSFFARINLVHHTDNMQIQNLIGKIRFYGALSSISIQTEYFREEDGLKPYIEKIDEFLSKTEKTKPFVNITENYSFVDYVMNFTGLSFGYFDDLMQHISEEAIAGRDVYSYLDILIQPSLNMLIFENNCELIVPHISSLSEMYSHMFTVQRSITSYNNLTNLPHDSDTCELSQNFFFLYDGSVRLYDDITAHQKDDMNKIRKKFIIYAAVAPTIYFFLIYIPIVTLHFHTLYVEEKMKQIVESIDQESKNEAKESLRVNCAGDEDVIADNENKTGKRIFLVVFAGIFALYFVLVILVACLISLKSTDNVVKLDEWNEFAASRLALAAESLNTMLNSIIMVSIPGSYKESDYAAYLKLSYFILQKFKQSDEDLVSGTNRSKPCENFDLILDELNIIDDKFKNNATSPAEFYEHTSIHQQVEIYKNFAMQVLTDMMSGRNFSITEAANLIFLSDYMMLDKVLEAADRILELGNTEVTRMRKNYLYCAIAMIIGAFFFIGSMVVYYHNRLSSYNAALSIIKRINPYTLLNNVYFAKYFLKENKTVDGEKLTIEASVIKNTNDAIFCTNVYGVVETANSAVTQLLGYTPEQILGQSVSSFFSSDQTELINVKMDQMRNRQSSTYFEDDFVVITDASKSVHVQCSIIGMKSSNENVKSFVFILKNTQRLTEQKRQAESEKEKGEKLLYQILPRDIVIQINKGETDISFQVPSATIVFIDINKFSDYSANLTPNNIMANLSYYFSILDSCAGKFANLTKIKLIGDIYMAACGLFMHEDQPEAHAEEAVLFCFDVLKELEEINKKLDSNLQIRIGVNTGGPLHAGVLGMDKPAFDIIGDPINIAARLQSTSDVDHVHISEYVKELLQGKNFEFVNRGETFLKGKGNQTTYYVTLKPETYHEQESEHSTQQ